MSDDEKVKCPECGKMLYPELVRHYCRFHKTSCKYYDEDDSPIFGFKEKTFLKGDENFTRDSYRSINKNLGENPS